MSIINVEGSSALSHSIFGLTYESTSHAASRMRARHMQPHENTTRTCLCTLSRVWLFVTLWPVVHQAPLSMGFSRQEYWRGLPFRTPGDIPNTGIEPEFLHLRHWQADSLPLLHLGSRTWYKIKCSVQCREHSRQSMCNNHPIGHQVAKEPSF